MLLSTVCLAALYAVTPLETEEIKVNNVSAQYVLDLISLQGRYDNGYTVEEREERDLIPDGVTVSITPRKNSLTASGKADAIRELAGIVALFDLAPKTVNLELSASVPSLKRQFVSTSSAINNSPVSFEDQSSETRLKITPRINGDKTVTVQIDGGALGTNTTFVIRVKSGETVYGQFIPTETFIDGEPRYALSAQYTTSPLDIDKFLKSENQPGLSIDWFTATSLDQRQADGSQVAEPSAEAELRFVISATID